MKMSTPVTIVLLLVSLFAGAVLSVMRAPEFVPAWLPGVRPLWLHMLIVFWVLAGAGRVGVVSGWFIGLLADTLLGTPLGVNAATGALVAYAALRAGPLLQQTHVVQQAIMLAPLFVMVAALQALVLLVTRSTAPGFGWLTSGLASAALWPLLVWLIGGRSLTLERAP